MQKYHPPYISTYKELSCIGKGNYGRVYKIQSLQTSRIYAAKKIPLQGMSESELHKTKQQIQIHSKLNHINVLQLYDSYVSPKQIILILQYCEFGDLGFYIHQRMEEVSKEGSELFEEKFIMNLFIQILYGLNYLHEHKIVHRDIKPSNIFIDSEGRVKLADFGIASILESTGSFISSSNNNIIGTPRYLSPEVCLNKLVTYKSDIWALGCVLYELCTLKPVFQANNILALAKLIAEAQITNISNHYSQDMNALIHWMLERDSNLRPYANQVLHLTFIKDYSNKFMGIYNNNNNIPQEVSVSKNNPSLLNKTNMTQSTPNPKPSLVNKQLSNKNNSNNFPIIQHVEELMVNSFEMNNQVQQEYRLQQERVKMLQKYQYLKCKLEFMLEDNEIANDNYNEIYGRIVQFSKEYTTVNQKDNQQIKYVLSEHFGKDMEELTFCLYEMIVIEQHLQNM